jgi:hypothetical protein
MADEVAHIHPQTLVEGVHVLTDRFPAHIDGAQHLHGNGFDIGEELGQPFFVAPAHRRQGQRAVADDHRRGAVITGEAAHRIPGHLRIIVAMVIDEPRGHHQAVGINGARGRPAQFAGGDNFTVGDSHVPSESGHSRAIDHATVLD